MRCLIILVISLILSSCSLFTNEAEQSPPSIADLKPIKLPTINTSIDTISVDAVISNYKQALSTSTDIELRSKIKQRLASLQAQQSESALNDEGQAASFTTAVSAYEALIEEFPKHANMDKILYQLAKTYELNGQREASTQSFLRLVNEFPQSEHRIESHFRLAEVFFSEAQYRKAAKHYAIVSGAGNTSAYHQKSIYMLAWANFKSERYDASIAGFMASLNTLLPEPGIETAKAKADQAIIDDCFRVLSIIFASLDGAMSINNALKEQGTHHYDHLLYTHLADHYLSQQRYEDSALTYKTYIDANPLSSHSHIFQANIIGVYQKGGFAEEILLEKIRYIDTYNIKSDYWLASSLAIQLEISSQLKPFLKEMANYHHVKAQTLKRTTDVAKTDKKSVDRLITINNHYKKAAKYYRLYIDSFPGVEDFYAVMYLLAEVHNQLNDYETAINLYERVAFEKQFHDIENIKRARESAYAAIVGYDDWLANIQSQLALTNDKQTLRASILNITNHKITTELLFAKYFPEDVRAASVLANAAELLLKAERYTEAIQAAEQLTQWQPQPKASLLLSAWLIIGQSAFDSKDYLLAEQGYQQALYRLEEKDKRYFSTKERYAASIYQQGEQAQTANDNVMAIEHYLRVISFAPLSSIRETAQYDAGTLLLSEKKYQQAADLLVDFRQRFSTSILAIDISAKLAFAYQELEAWLPAAEETMLEFKRAENPVDKAALLFLAADLYDKANDKSQAVNQFRYYAHNYPDPFDQNIEAMYRLTELYQQMGEDAKRRFWLNKLITVDANAGSKRTDRSRYLAAWSSSLFADDAYQAFQAIDLTLPLKQSFKSKKKAMQLAQKRYEKTLAYAITEFSTLATFRLAEIYAQLSRDLLASARPKNLDALALEQYELLLEEQAYPFEEKAISIHEKNTEHSWQGVYNTWVKNSFKALKVLLPARYAKEEQDLQLSTGIY